MEADYVLLLEDACSINERLWYMARYAQSAAEWLDAGSTERNWVEAVELREALEWLQALSLEVGEALDAYQDRYTR